MEFRTKIEIDKPHFQIEPCEEILFVGSCFADAIGRRFSDEGFPATINPYGVMYNPASILHTIERWIPTQLGKGKLPRIVFLTLGTNHVYRLKSTGEIVDNCEKRPQKLFQEESAPARKAKARPCAWTIPPSTSPSGSTSATCPPP